MFVCYTETDKTIWGYGSTKAIAKKEAKEWIDENGNPEDLQHLVIKKTTPEFRQFQESSFQFRYGIEWTVKDDTAVIAWLEVDCDLATCIENTEKSLKSMTGGNKGLLTSVLINQLAIMKKLL